MTSGSIPVPSAHSGNLPPLRGARFPAFAFPAPPSAAARPLLRFALLILRVRSETAPLAPQQPWRTAPGSASAVCYLAAARFRAGAPASVPLSLREPHLVLTSSTSIRFRHFVPKAQSFCCSSSFPSDPLSLLLRRRASLGSAENPGRHSRFLAVRPGRCSAPPRKCPPTRRRFAPPPLARGNGRRPCLLSAHPPLCSSWYLLSAFAVPVPEGAPAVAPLRQTAPPIRFADG